jgi:4-hydroxybenzoate polyprenyltransferase
MRPVIQLLRLDKPIGIWLVFFPAGWAVALAAAPGQLLRMELIMLAGAALMRSAGCVLNDLADRKLDARVERTKTRPLAAGTISVRTALMLLAVLLLAALALLGLLPLRVFWLALVAVPMIAAYPWMKRLTWWPQLFLGLTFNLSALFGWLATGALLTLPALLLYAAAVFWTLGYDTIYAVQDMEDDAQAGIKSTARRFSSNLRHFVGGCYLLMLALLAASFHLLGVGALAWLGYAAAACHAFWQYRRLPPKPQDAGYLFRSNQWLGLAVLAGIVLARLL